MKTILKTIIILLLLVCISCIQDQDYQIPEITITEPNINVNSSLSKVKTALQQEFNANNNTKYTFPINENSPTFIEVFVVSTDATGNFYKKLIVQDAVENPTSGIEILINKSDLSTLFSIGQKVFIKLDGLTVSYDDGQSDINPTNVIIGKYVLGYLDSASLVNIPSTIIKNHFFRSSIIASIVPTKINISTITEAHMNTLVSFENMQFEKAELGKTFAGEANDEFDGFRYLLDCETEQTIRLQTSTFSSFKSTIIPEYKGTIDVVLSKDYTSEFLVTIINTPSNINFNSTDRCDPVFLDCGGTITNNNKVIFNEDFENIKSNTALLKAGWSNINVNGKNTKFTSKTSGGNRAIELSAYNSGESPLEVWLISPPINLENSSKEILSFETNTGYDNGKVMTVYISTDYTGDINTATWTLLDAKLSEGPNSGYGTRFTESGNIDISCLTGDVNIAFKYVGSDGGITTTFRIDNIKVTAD